MAVPTTACIIGAGPGGIAMGYHLKQKLKCDDFAIVDQNSGAGGTWFTNTYPGCGCDVPSHFYSFSFALNPNWSRPLCEQGEILEYLNDVVDKFDLRGHLSLSTKVIRATWNEDLAVWEVELQNLRNKHIYKRRFRAVVSATGIFSNPRWPKIDGMETFQGTSWHTGEWNWSHDLTGKRVAVIGNGCSGCQVIPAIAPKAGHIIHLARGKQWLFARPNEPYSSFALWMFRAVPGWMRWIRLSTYYSVEQLYLEYVKNPMAEGLRAQSEKEAREYMVMKTPKRYHDAVIPDFPVGCKRRVMDPGYLESLHRPNVSLCPEKIDSIDGSGVRLANGEHIDADVLIFATGFYTQEYLSPMTITGQGGCTLTDHWKDTAGCQAYLGTSVSGFPNFAMLFGPNSSPAHNSVIFVLEVQAEYIVQALFEPLLTGRAKTITVKRSAEDYDNNWIQQKLENGVWHQGCNNWTTNDQGRNCTTFPGYIRSFWWKLYSPRFRDYILTDGDMTWPIKHLGLKLRARKPFSYFILPGLLAGVIALTRGTSHAAFSTLRAYAGELVAFIKAFRS